MTPSDSPILHLVAPRDRDLGAFAVRRILPVAAARAVGPFVFVDHFGPVELAPGAGMNVRPHPHIGLATITWLWAGRIVHRDSLGSVRAIEPGAVNWMTAGRGIVHSERSDPADVARGQRLHGLQTWVALPREHEEDAPAFVHVEARALPRVAVGDATVTVVAGTAFGARAPTPVLVGTLYAAVALPARGSIVLDAEHDERSVYAVDTDLAVDGVPVPRHHMAILAPGRTVTISTAAAGHAMLIGGAKLDGERFLWWNFVSSSRERIERAKDDWREQRFDRVPGETELIPLPDR